ncbi:hypothetical protein ACRXLK_003255 [Cronobacter turicensis]|uniref:hypothetical protein n=1 Tax=Cronobacter turicensis TaxID=413502 RepID=UPI000CFB8655|nr:hypothetical protein [Cronobacter turicensis]EKM0363929.1 hypothetical protein [Cronobacter turicensis]EKY3193290.1 hypothetical protein [Cronobacter turicensis]ELQ6020199.1 hypothetical protein [Cronobacter turicensis]ELQ6076425.1 hypothetical protein [Cronobacter turicensis]ELQ6183387.1 hypothetical protein [Cronobacter turicensis]
MRVTPANTIESIIFCLLFIFFFLNIPHMLFALLHTSELRDVAAMVNVVPFLDDFNAYFIELAVVSVICSLITTVAGRTLWARWGG